METKPFQINFLDHVAIRVKDLELAAQWYKTTLGLKRYQLEAWGAFPVFMLAGKTGIALFPLKSESIKVSQSLPMRSIDHFAFNVDQAHFELAQKHLDKLGIAYTFQDHNYFHSIYMKDLDEHTVELTTIVVPEHSFYQ